MPAETPAARGRRLVDALIVWITPDGQLERGMGGAAQRGLWLTTTRPDRATSSRECEEKCLGAGGAAWALSAVRTPLLPTLQRVVS